LTDQLVLDLVALLDAEDKEQATAQLIRTFSAWTTELIGRAASQSASVSVPIIARVEEVKTIVEDLRHRERARTERYDEFRRGINGQVDALHREVETLQRAVNDDASNEARPGQS
jgi:hypothetical protein